MNSQNTPVHIKLWNREFWQMAIANLLLSMTVYILLPVFPLWLKEKESFSAIETGWAMGVFALGLYAMGPFCSYLIQHYRRNKVCLWSVVVMALAIAGWWYTDSTRLQFADYHAVYLHRILLGVAFGLAQMVLTSTLVIDTCESYLRTEANHNMAWFGRFSLSLGPATGMLVYQTWGLHMVMMTCLGCLLAAFLLIRLVKFPFRAPADHVKVVSCDRFWLSSGWLLFLNLLLVSTAIGIIIIFEPSVVFYGMLMVGFLLSLLAQRFVFRDAELKSEVVTGLILMMASLLLMWLKPADTSVFVAPVLIGIACGLIGSRFLLFFIKLSRHCQRGTSQSTYMLAWESGLAIGVGLCLVIQQLGRNAVMATAMSLVVVAMLVYNFLVHKWFVNHKNR